MLTREVLRARRLRGAHIVGAVAACIALLLAQDCSRHGHTRLDAGLARDPMPRIEERR